MSDANAQQIADWNGPQGRRWAELQGEREAVVAPFGVAVLERAAARPRERVIDIGCGCGETTFALADAVGAGGHVLGVDVSQPMLEAARAQAGGAWAQIEWREADASEADLPAGVDLLFSRFGIMFFADPAPALAHLRRALRPQGRCVFVCWRTPRDNPWAMTPLVAVRKALAIESARADPTAPGPFAFADEARLRGLLAEAGYAAIDIRRFDAAIRIGASASAAAETALRIGPASFLMRQLGPEREPAARAAVEAALAPLAAADGSVSLGGSTWIVSAVNP